MPEIRRSLIGIFLSWIQGSTSRVTRVFNTALTLFWGPDGAGGWQPGSDAAQDIGAAATRPRDSYVSRTGGWHDGTRYRASFDSTSGITVISAAGATLAQVTTTGVGTLTTSLTFTNGNIVTDNRQTYTSSVEGAVTPAVTRYIHFGTSTLSATDIRRHRVSACNTLILRVNLGTAPGGADTVTVTLMKDGVATAMTVTITGAATNGLDNVNVVAVGGGSELSFRVVSSATSVAADLDVAMDTQYLT